MKKITALVLLLVLMMGALVACNQVKPTEKKVRWENSETWTYNISLADFSPYATTDGTFFQDFLYSGETSPYSYENSGDRVVPQQLEGQYVVTVAKNSETTKVTTTQTMLATYQTPSPDSWTQFAEYIQSTTDTSITLKSTTETEVVFKTGPAQTPVSSYTKVDGFYIGKQYQCVSKYEVSTKYEVESTKTYAEVKLNNNEAKKYTIDGANVIDNNQVLMYIRSYEKTSTGFQDNPQAMVFDPLTAQAKKLSFVYTAEQNFVIDHKFADASESAKVITKVNRLDVLLGGLPFMTQLNLPDLTSKGLDQVGTDVWNVYLPKHTICRFRVGFASYQLTGYLDDAMVDAIQVKAEE